jgi:hypothetical protein
MGHSIENAAPAKLYIPAGVVWHIVCPVSLLYLPGAQFVHVAAPVKEYLPAAHIAHEPLPALSA